MAFDALQVKAVEGLISFFQIWSAVDQPTHHQHSVGEKERLGKKKWTHLNITNNLVLQRWHFIPLVICKYIFYIWDVKCAWSSKKCASASSRLTLLSCSPNFPRASITRYTHAKHEPILKSKITNNLKWCFKKNCWIKTYENTKFCK